MSSPEQVKICATCILFCNTIDTLQLTDFLSGHKDEATI